MFLLNANRIVCNQKPCAGDVMRLLRTPDDLCDFCGRVPKDGQYRETTLSLGRLMAFGHQCSECEWLNELAPEHIAEYYNCLAIPEE